MLISFITSVLISYFIVQLSNHVEFLTNHGDICAIQRCHENSTARIGGIAVFLGFSIGMWLLQDQSDVLLVLWLASLPVFFGGLVEDLSARISPVVRLLFASISIIIAFVWLNIGITSLGFELVDYVLSNYTIIVLLFTLLVVGGAINSLNIIDGYNGLMAGYSILASLAMASVAYTLGDNFIINLNLLLASSISGFFVLNFPSGKIFMGDGGAYFVGFMLAIIGLILVDRHEELSNWFVLLIFIYPMYELLYSIYRRKVIHKTDASQPDAEHLHSLVYKKLISYDRFKHNKLACNSLTSPLMWSLSLVGIIPAVIWHDNQDVLIFCVFLFMAVYTIIYYLVRNTKPKRDRRAEEIN